MDSLSRPLLEQRDTAAHEESGNKPHILVLTLLSSFDLSATILSGIGLRYVTGSANQMLRGSMIFFTGIFRVLIFRENLRVRQWLGIGIVMLGLILVGVTGIVRGGDQGSTNASGSQALGGVMLILAGSALNSLQNVLEEKLLKGTTVDAMEVVGWEGIFGMLLSMILVLPVAQAISGPDVNSQENTTDSLVMLCGNAGMMFVVLGYAVALAFMNFFSQLVSQRLSAVHRMLISTLRTVLVWIIFVFIYYAIPHGQGYGEKVDLFSLIQLLGFGLLVCGTFVYISQPATKVNSIDNP